PPLATPNGALTAPPGLGPGDEAPDGRTVPAVGEASPKLSEGTLADAEQATEAKMLIPAYLPAGAEREDEVIRFDGRDGQGIVWLPYRIGQRHLVIEYAHYPDQPLELNGGDAVQVGPFEGRAFTKEKEPTDQLPAESMVVWRDGETTMRVSGDIPMAELVKVAGSLYTGSAG
ncbi:MAG: hypothetical protein ACYC1C_06100, partial [Chloroflexota bacterium]